MIRVALFFALFISPAFAQQSCEGNCNNPTTSQPRLVAEPQMVPVPAPLLDKTMTFLSRLPYAQVETLMAEWKDYAAQYKKTQQSPAEKP